MGSDAPFKKIPDPTTSNSTVSDLHNILDPLHLTFASRSGPSLNDQLQQSGSKQDAQAAALQPPTLKDATTKSIFSQVQDTQRRMASRTLFTGGMGVLDSPSTASTTLLGL